MIELCVCVCWCCKRRRRRNSWCGKSFILMNLHFNEEISFLFSSRIYVVRCWCKMNVSFLMEVFLIRLFLLFEMKNRLLGCWGFSYLFQVLIGIMKISAIIFYLEQPSFILIFFSYLLFFLLQNEPISTNTAKHLFFRIESSIFLCIRLVMVINQQNPPIFSLYYPHSNCLSWSQLVVCLCMVVILQSKGSGEKKIRRRKRSFRKVFKMRSKWFECEKRENFQSWFLQQQQQQRQK